MPRNAGLGTRSARVRWFLGGTSGYARVGVALPSGTRRRVLVARGSGLSERYRSSVAPLALGARVMLALWRYAEVEAQAFGG